MGRGSHRGAPTGGPGAPAKAVQAAAGRAGKAAAAASGAGKTGNPPKKPRKPYTITKQRESWAPEEHKKFIDALQLYDRDWKKIEAYVGTKTVTQIRSHAQKYFLKVAKNGTGEHVPPPRPKKKSQQPYPQKAKTEKAAKGRGGRKDDAGKGKGAAAAGPSTAGGGYVTGVGPTGPMVGGVAPMGMGMGGVPQGTPGGYLAPPGVPMEMAKPNFARVYTFLGSLFDTNPTGEQVQNVGHLEPVERETAWMLMKNLFNNLPRTELWQPHLQQVHAKQAAEETAKKEGEQADSKSKKKK